MPVKQSRPTSAEDNSPSPGHNSMVVEFQLTTALKPNPDSPRVLRKLHEQMAVKALKAQKYIPPVVIDEEGVVLIGELIWRAARTLKIEWLPTVRVDNLTDAEKQAMAISYQRLAEFGEWDDARLGALHLRFEAEIPDYQTDHIGFEVGAMDIVLKGMGDAADSDAGEEDVVPDPLASDVATSLVGDMWMLGKHRILCGDSTQASTFGTLMSNVSKAALVFTDPPFGCAINGFVSGDGNHREFVMGSGDMTPDQLRDFFASFLRAMLPHVRNGAVVELVIDWRSLHLLLSVSEPLLGPLINLAVWAKDRPGQGSFLRSQHELILIFSVGKGRFRNNVNLGRSGRNRSNVWSYPSAKTASTGSDEGNMLKSHPTPSL